jgi:hypothetical protein
MSVTSDADDAVAAARASVLADVLALGLPDPNYITFTPHSGHEVFGFQFSRAAHGLTALRVWAERFGSEISVTPAIDNPEQVYVSTSFMVSGLMFRAYGFFPEHPASRGDQT